MINYKRIILFFLILKTLSAQAQENTDLEVAIDKLNFDKTMFTFEVLTNIYHRDEKFRNSQTIVKYDPNEDPAYILLSRNGKKPTKKDLKDYYEQRKKNSTSWNAADYLGKEFQLISSDNETETYKFVSKKNIIPFISSKMDGEITYNKNLKNVIRIELFSNEPRLVFPGVYLELFKMKMEFESFSNNEVVVKDMVTFIDGKIFGKELHQKMVMEFYNYMLAN